MKRIIGGRKYDTETARMVASWDNGRFASDFGYCCETLYCKRNGEYFLHGEGGASSRYAEECGQNEWRAGEAITPLDWDVARSWAEEHMDADGYEREFGEIGEDDGDVVAVTVRISEAARLKLQREAARTGESQGEIVQRLIMRL